MRKPIRKRFIHFNLLVFRFTLSKKFCTKLHFFLYSPKLSDAKMQFGYYFTIHLPQSPEHYRKKETPESVSSLVSFLPNKKFGQPIVNRQLSIANAAGDSQRGSDGSQDADCQLKNILPSRIFHFLSFFWAVIYILTPNEMFSFFNVNFRELSVNFLVNYL